MDRREPGLRPEVGLGEGDDLFDLRLAACCRAGYGEGFIGGIGG